MFFVVGMIYAVSPGFASEPVYETKCGQDAIEVGQLCIAEEKEPTESEKLFSWFKATLNLEGLGI